MDENRLKEKFKAHFDLPQDGFLVPIDLNDVEIGFSVYKERSQKGFKSLLRVYVKPETMKTNSPLKALVVTASYGKETENGITVSSSEFKKGRNWPIDLSADDEFFYNVKENKLFDKTKKEVTGLQILQYVDGLHIKPTKPLLGFWLRTKLFWFHTVFVIVMKFLFDIFSTLQYLISGKQIEIFDNLTDPKDRAYPSIHEDLKVTRGKPIKIFEYEVEPWIAALYSIFHFAIYAVCYFYDFKPSWLVTIFKNNFLTTMYVILSLGLANAILPEILKPNKTFTPVLLAIQTLYLRCALKKFRV